MTNQLVEARKKAEQAVSDMREGDIKTKAFETILQHLLSGMAGAEQRPGKQPKSRTAPHHKAANATAAKSCTDRILFIKSDGFFDAQRSIGEIRTELKKNGWHYPVTSLSGPLQSLVQSRQLRREHVQDGEGRKGWKYSNP